MSYPADNPAYSPKLDGRRLYFLRDQKEVSLALQEAETRLDPVAAVLQGLRERLLRAEQLVQRAQLGPPGRHAQRQLLRPSEFVDRASQRFELRAGVGLAVVDAC